MSETATTTKKRTASPVQPFSVEITGNCSDVIVQSIPGCKLRGAISPVKKVFGTKNSGKTTVAPSGIIPGMPELPGMQLHVYPGKCECKITDPLHGDKETCATIRELIDRNTGYRVNERFDGVPPRKEQLEPSRMKTLVRELLSMIDSDLAKMDKGVRPEMDDVDKLPGHYLLNPGSRIPNTQPRYEKDMPAFLEKLMTG